MGAEQSKRSGQSRRESAPPQWVVLSELRERNPSWRIDWTLEAGYTARLESRNYGPLRAATGEGIEEKIRGACIGRIGPPAPPTELTPLLAKYPRYWIQDVPAGTRYLAVWRGTFPLLAGTLEEMERLLSLSKSS